MPHAAKEVTIVRKRIGALKECPEEKVLNAPPLPPPPSYRPHREKGGKKHPRGTKLSLTKISKSS